MRYPVDLSVPSKPEAPKAPELPQPVQPQWMNQRSNHVGSMGRTTGTTVGLAMEGEQQDKLSGPSVPVRLNDATSVSVGAGSTGVQYQTQSALFAVDVGMGYVSYDRQPGRPRTPFAASARAAYLFTSNLAAGADLNFSALWSEAVGNLVYHLPNLPYLLFGSAAYATGTQSFNFSGTAKDIKLGQVSYLLGGSYLLSSSKDYLGLQSVTLKTWGARAHRRDDEEAPDISTTDTPTESIVSITHYALSLGQLYGVSLGGQYAFVDNLVGTASLGYESVRYPFGDGSVELDRAVYRSLSIAYQPGWWRELVVGAAYNRGAAENRFAVSAQLYGFNLSLYLNRGLNGASGDRGVEINYSVPLDGHVIGSGATSLAQRMNPASFDSPTGLLQLAATRPVELPQVFLAKVDNTMNRTVSLEKSCLDGGITVDKHGMTVIPVGPAPLTLIGATRDSGNGPAPTSSHSIFTISGGNLLLNVLALPSPAVTDNYVATIADEAGSTYQVFVTAARGGDKTCMQKKGQ